MTFFLFCLSLFLTFNTLIKGQTVWINEFHYDNIGQDVNEQVEIAGLAGTDLTDYALYFYNGRGGILYNLIILSGIIPNDNNGYGFLSFRATFPIQDADQGAPDGIVLADNTDTVLEFLCYGGTFQAVGGLPGGGTTCIDIGVIEEPTTPVNFSLQLGGTLQNGFEWQEPQLNTFGRINTGQSFLGCDDILEACLSECDLTTTIEPTSDETDKSDSSDQNSKDNSSGSISEYTDSQDSSDDSSNDSSDDYSNDSSDDDSDDSSDDRRRLKDSSRSSRTSETSTSQTSKTSDTSSSDDAGTSTSFSSSKESKTSSSVSKNNSNPSSSDCRQNCQNDFDICLFSLSQSTTMIPDNNNNNARNDAVGVYIGNSSTISWLVTCIIALIFILLVILTIWLICRNKNKNKCNNDNDMTRQTRTLSEGSYRKPKHRRQGTTSLAKQDSMKNVIIGEFDD